MFVGGDGTHDVLVDAFLRRLAGEVRIVPTVVVVTELLDDLVILLDLVFVHARAISHILAHLHVAAALDAWFSATVRCLHSLIDTYDNLTEHTAKH